MIDEFFILKSTNLIYHYSTSQEEKNLDKIILSSGLLSALDAFAKKARSNTINSFQTDNEIFKYAALPETDIILVFVFNNEIFNENLSDLIINNIYELVLNSEIINNSSNLVDLQSSSSYQLNMGIEYILKFKLAQQFSDEHLSDLLIKEKKIDFCVIKEVPSGTVIASYSKIMGYLSNTFLRNHDLIISVINRALVNLELSKKFLITTFESKEQQFLIFNMESYSISFLTSERKSSEFFLELLKNFMFSSNLFNFARYKMANFEISTKYSSDSSGKIVFEKGILLSRKANVFLGTLSNNIRNFSKEVLSKILEVFSIVYVNNQNELSILKANLESNNEMKLEIFVD